MVTSTGYPDVRDIGVPLKRDFDSDLKPEEIRVTVERYGDRKVGVISEVADPEWWADLVKMTLEESEPIST